MMMYIVSSIFSYTSCMLDIEYFSSNHNIHKSTCGLCFWASDPLLDRFSKAYQTKATQTFMKVVI